MNTSFLSWTLSLFVTLLIFMQNCDIFLSVFCLHIECILFLVLQGMVLPLLGGWVCRDSLPLLRISHILSLFLHFFSLLLLSKAMSLAWMVSSYAPGSSGVVHWTVSFPIIFPYCVCPSTKTRKQYLCPLSTKSSIVNFLAACSASSASRMFMSPCPGSPIIFVIGFHEFSYDVFSDSHGLCNFLMYNFINARHSEYLMLIRLYIIMS